MSFNSIVHFLFQFRFPVRRSIHRVLQKEQEIEIEIQRTSSFCTYHSQGYAPAQAVRPIVI